MIHTEAALDHNAGIDTATTETAYGDLTQHTEDTATDLTMTHCIGDITDNLHIMALLLLIPRSE